MIIIPVISIIVIVNWDMISVFLSNIPFSPDLNEPFNIPAGLNPESIMAG